MNPSPRINTLTASERTCPHQDGRDIRWRKNLPTAWQSLVAVPVRFDIFQEYEIPAERTVGHDVRDMACYCAFSFVLSALKSDDGEFFYETPAHAESLTAWQLRDGRWLIYREAVADFDQGTVHRFFSFSDLMPQ